MRSQACEPCAKRKVRCDREDPCSNCKRRKQDRCSYPEPSPVDRIRKLEDLVRSLGGNPDEDVAPGGRPFGVASPNSVTVTTSPFGSQRPTSSSNGRSKDPVILEEDGQQHYLESRVWLTHGHLQGGTRIANAKHPLFLRNAIPAFQNIIRGRDSPISVSSELREHAQILWTFFKQRVHPFIRISFTWELERLESIVTLSPDSTQIDIAQNALIYSIYLSSITSLTESDCRTNFGLSKTLMLAKYQALCEESLAGTDILCMKNIMALKAMAVYLMASLDRLSTQSLWTLMGLAIRNGEKLGIHRDGTLLGMSPFETEERRRLWWHLQYLDLILAIRLGVTPSTLKAEWDARLPLNIEDGDFTPEMKTFPEERKGLTSMSYCLFTYYILDEQRQYHADKGRFELSWSTNQSVPMQIKEAFIDRLEDGLNKRFLQYCDPIKPLHILIQLMSRALVCVFRHRILLTTGEYSDRMNQGNRGSLLALSMQLLEYAIVMHSHRLLRDFDWFTTNGFPWPAFMVVLVEASQETNIDACQRIWALLSDLYAANASLLELTEDRRRLHAAELIVAAWKTCMSKGTVSRSTPTPSMVSSLEKRLSECMEDVPQASAETEANGGIHRGVRELEIPESFLSEQEANNLLDLDLRDIDWSFWNSID
ncbi:hypothetical protein JX266_004352 [Neoarthrinium moseri]|nr:hypothetical protein JX266_004352 [Neoarthrinium moseri]